MPILAYVASTNVQVIDTSTNTVIDTVVAGAYPTGIAITPNGSFVYVTNIFTNDVTVINTCDNTVIANIRVGELPMAVAITPNGKFAYVANTFSNTVSVINTTTLAVVATIGVGNFPEGVAISPNGNFAYVTNTMSNTVSVIDTSTNTVTDTISVGPYPVSIAASPANLVYVAVQGLIDTNRNVTVIDIFTNTVIDTIPLNGTPTSLAVRPNRQYVYVTIGDTNSVDVIFTGSNRVVTSVAVGEFPLGIAFTPDSNFAYVTNIGSNDISVIDAISNTVVDTISVFQPMNIAIANIPLCAAPSDSMCIEATRIFDSCSFEERQQKTFNLPYPIEGQDIQCKVVGTDYSILDKAFVQQDLVNVKLRIKVIVGFVRKCSDDYVFKEVVYFDRNITLAAPEGANISCEINNATCECIGSGNLSCNQKVSCTVKVAAVVKSKKLVQIEVPVLGNCESNQCNPSEGIPVAPGKSYSLPSEPSNVSRIKFAVRTDPGMTSRFTAFLNAIPYTFTTVTEELKSFEINIPGDPYPVENISLRNLGKSVIYVYDLTTE